MYMLTLMDELNSGLGVLLAVIALVVYGIAIVSNWVRMGARVDDNDKEIATLRGYSKTHFESIGRIEIAAATFNQQLTSHIADDNRQFGEVKETLAESRKDLKEMRSEILEAIAALRNGK